MYKSALFHLHSIMEGSTPSISGYCYEAQRVGVDVVWISDHDSRFFADPETIVPLDGDYGLQPLGRPESISLQKVDADQPRLVARTRSGS